MIRVMVPARSNGCYSERLKRRWGGSCSLARLGNTRGLLLTGMGKPCRLLAIQQPKLPEAQWWRESLPAGDLAPHTNLLNTVGTIRNEELRMTGFLLLTLHFSFSLIPSLYFTPANS